MQRQTEQQRGRRAKPAPPEWIVELGIGVGRQPVQVHRGACYMAGKRHRPVDREEARRLLADGTSPCSHCRPDTGLGVIGLAARGIGRWGFTPVTGHGQRSPWPSARPPVHGPQARP
ncbi:DUF6233 domain-containing protein [Streptomyces cinerochromogenes]|uniref:DUF6233 domain-containing protein n=1 Tax=Streptomyces cinerochromogenes TaxID=66422 RepID=UPI0036BC2648